MANFDLSKYSEVKDRIAEFVKDFPNGAIQTFLVTKDGPEVVFEARIFREPSDVLNNVYTSGFAREIEGKSPVNKTSHLENCETSAIGRALANMAYGADAERASRSEMIKVARMNEEHDAMLAYIKDVFPKLNEDTEGVVEGEPVKLLSYIKTAGKQFPENFRLCRSVVDALEASTGIKFTDEA